MKRLLNTLYVLSEDAYLTLDGENLVTRRGGKDSGRIPLHTIESIVSFSYAGASPALMGACAQRGIALSFFSPRGKFLAKVQGGSRGNVLLRRQQYRWADSEDQSLLLAKYFIIGKLFNSRQVLERAIRDHGVRINIEKTKTASLSLKESISKTKGAASLAELRGIEGDAAAVYFDVF